MLAVARREEEGRKQGDLLRDYGENRVAYSLMNTMFSSKELQKWYIYLMRKE